MRGGEDSIVWSWEAFILGEPPTHQQRSQSRRRAHVFFSSSPSSSFSHHPLLTETRTTIPTTKTHENDQRPQYYAMERRSHRQSKSRHSVSSQRTRSSRHESSRKNRQDQKAEVRGIPTHLFPPFKSSGRLTNLPQLSQKTSTSSTPPRTPRSWAKSAPPRSALRSPSNVL